MAKFSPGRHLAEEQTEPMMAVEYGIEVHDPPSDERSARAAIHVGRLKKDYGKVQAIRGIDFEVGEGEIFGVIGPDGAGKTTTLQILAGVMEATSEWLKFSAAGASNAPT